MSYKKVIRFQEIYIGKYSFHTKKKKEKIN